MNKQGQVTNLEFVEELGHTVLSVTKTMGGSYEMKSSYFTTGPSQWTGQYTAEIGIAH